jgi:adenylosuccinate lyase
VKEFTWEVPDINREREKLWSKSPNSIPDFQLPTSDFQLPTRNSIFASLIMQPMSSRALQAISPIDGRYASKTQSLIPFFSEEALMRYRVQIEIEYFIALVELPLPQLKDFDYSVFPKLRSLYTEFDSRDAQRIKETETITNHDVKAVEYFIKEEFDALGLQKYKEFIHFGLTSQDINNTAIPLSLKDAMNEVYVPGLFAVKNKLKDLAGEWANVPMLARTHGQPASPTRLGKEIDVFVVRLEEQFDLLNDIKSAAKFGGATGNFNAHKVAYPDIDWKTFGTQFVQEKLGLHHSFPTTQIEHYDHMAALFDCLKRINTILIDLDRDIWTYVSMDYFKQKIKKGEIGSSAMPHKVNPIDFENSEGNLGMANAVFEYLSAKLPISRLQRDLTDSTVLRNIGVPIGHTIIGLQSTLKGLNKLLLNETKIKEDLEKNWVVVAEAIQTILRREGYPNPYEALKGLTRTNEAITRDSIQDFINTLKVSEEIKKELRQISPSNYTGI